MTKNLYITLNVVEFVCALSTKLIPKKKNIIENIKFTKSGLNIFVIKYCAANRKNIIIILIMSKIYTVGPSILVINLLYNK